MIPAVGSSPVFRRVVPFPTPYRRSFLHSQIFTLSRYYDVEIVHQPYHEATVDIAEKLWNVLMRSCEKSEDEDAGYREKISIWKVALNVDYLVLASRQDQLVAFTSGSYIDRELFYINAAMVLPEFQATGIGGFLTCMLAFNPVIANLQAGIEETHMVCRTQNRQAASLFLHACEGAAISTEPLSDRVRSLLMKTTAFLHCDLEAATGITRNIYPEGLPKGCEIHNDRINRAFAGLGPTDACYIIGRLKLPLVTHLLKGKLEPKPLSMPTAVVL